jgi:hypothetical protein
LIISTLIPLLSPSALTTDAACDPLEATTDRLQLGRGSFDGRLSLRRLNPSSALAVVVETRNLPYAQLSSLYL